MIIIAAVALPISRITAILVFSVVSADLASNLTLSTRIPTLEVILLSTSLKSECWYNTVLYPHIEANVCEENMP